ncbi:hypothetical protein HPB51_027378 [Rhipicephalus microplus]|uniref:DDE Tnp4 domain-containing protein n=1 Tax=Rhipicephalus microplus TaxID=6941 RepID=A0A9J6D028_RHIMP|nr:hypothetical protein HPB51_027378 [Rhipicephalus microplus]
MSELQLKKNTDRRGTPLPPLLKVLITLRFYGTGAMQTVVGDLVRVSQQYVSRCVWEITQVQQEPIKTRNSVELHLECGKGRFACLRVKLLTDTDRSAAIITACAALHNIACLRRDPCPLSDEAHPDVNLPDNPSQGDPDTVAGAQVRSCYIRRCFSSGNEHTGPVQT